MMMKMIMWSISWYVDQRDKKKEEVLEQKSLSLSSVSDQHCLCTYARTTDTCIVYVRLVHGLSYSIFMPESRNTNTGMQ